MERKIESFEIVEGYCADEVKIEFDPSKFDMVKKKGGYYVVKKQPQYPKTFEDCCKVLGLTELGIIGGYRHGLLTQFRNLLICRDAYWEIGGIPDTKGNTCCCLYYDITDNDIYKELGPFDINSILIFPTQEICDMFYENFKELINECKSLL